MSSETNKRSDDSHINTKECLSSSLQCENDKDEEKQEKSSDLSGFKFVTYFNFKLYLQDNNFSVSYNKLTKELQSWFQSTEVKCLRSIGNPEIDSKIYAALIDSKIERIIIKYVEPDKITHEKRYKCYLVDTGTSTNISENQVFLIPEELERQPPLTKPYFLFGVYLERHAHRKIYNWLSKRFCNKSLTIRKMCTKSRNNEFVQIFVENSLINKEICDSGLGEFRNDPNKQETKTGGTVKSKGKTHKRSDRKSVPNPTQPTCHFRANENGTNTIASLCAIPPPSLFSGTFNAAGIERDRLIDSLKGEIRAYRDLLATQKQSNFSSKMQSTSEKLKELIFIRSCVNRFICDESPLIRSVSLLLDDATFHNLVDCATQEGNDIRKMIEKSAEIPLETIKGFEAQVSSLKLNQRVFSLQILQEELHGAVNEMRSSSPVFKYHKKDNIESVTYTRIGKELLLWKNQYLKTQSDTNKAMKELTSFLEECSGYFKNIMQGTRDKETPQFTFLGSQDVLKVYDEEFKHIEKIDCIPVACESVHHELNLRLLKMKNVDEMLKEISSLDPQLISERNFDIISPAAQEEEETYPTLLSFITQSKSMNPKTKYLIVKDIFIGLNKLHEMGETYFYLSPSNVLISEGAILCPPNKIQLYEPIPPFKFFAPECQMNNKNSAPNTPFTGVDYSADFFSLGQIILWLASVDSDVNFLGLMIDLQQRFPILKKLILEDPKLRPGAEELETAIEEVLPQVFGITKEDLDFDTNGSKENDTVDDCASSSGASSLSLTDEKIVKMIEEEDDLISREMQDSDDEVETSKIVNLIN